jgi:hypothetical protein
LRWTVVPFAARVSETVPAPPPVRLPVPDGDALTDALTDAVGDADPDGVPPPPEPPDDVQPARASATAATPTPHVPGRDKRDVAIGISVSVSGPVGGGYVRWLDGRVREQVPPGRQVMSVP